MNKALITLVGLVAGVTAARAETPDQSAIRSQLEEWVRVAERGDTEAYLGFVTEDAVIMAPGQPEVVGRAAIGPWVKAFFASYSFAFGDWRSQEVDVRGDVAIHRYTGVATLTPKAGGEPRREERKYLDVLRRGPDGKWRASHHAFSLSR